MYRCNFRLNVAAPPFSTLPTLHFALECCANSYLLRLSHCRGCCINFAHTYAAGSSGDVADAQSPAGHKGQWLLPRGMLEYHAAPGHSPGLVCLSAFPHWSLSGCSWAMRLLNTTLMNCRIVRLSSQLHQISCRLRHAVISSCCGG